MTSSLATFSPRLWIHVLVLLSLLFDSRATLLNVTVDDTLGDLQTGSKPEYSGAWVSSSNCSVFKYDNPLCDLGLDEKRLEKGTWTGTSSDSSSVSIVFNGIAIYTFFAVPSSIFKTTISYSLDGGNITGMATDNIYTPSTTVRYNTSLIQLVNLTQAQHNLTIFVGSSANATLKSRQSELGAIFDYALYTTAENPTVKQPLANHFTIPSTASTTNSDPPDIESGEVTLTSQNLKPSLSTDRINAVTPSQVPTFGLTFNKPPTSSKAGISTIVEGIAPKPTDAIETGADNTITTRSSDSQQKHSSTSPNDVGTASTPSATVVTGPGQTFTQTIVTLGGSQGTRTLTVPVTQPSGTGSTSASLSSPSPTPTSSDRTHAPQDKRAPAGIIAGAIVGGLMCILVVSLIILLCLRRSRSFASLLPAKLVRTRSADTIRSFMTREFSPIPPEIQHKRAYPGRNRLNRSSSAERLIPSRCFIASKWPQNIDNPATSDPVRERLLTERPLEAPPVPPSAVRFRPTSLLSPDSTVSSTSTMDFRPNTGLESDYQRRIYSLEAEVQRLQGERDYLAYLTFDEELPDYSSNLNSPSPRFSLRNSSRNSTRDNIPQSA